MIKPKPLADSVPPIGITTSFTSLHRFHWVQRAQEPVRLQVEAAVH